MRINIFLYGCIGWATFIHGLVFFDIGKEIGSSPTILIWSDFIMIPFVMCWFPMAIGFIAGYMHNIATKGDK